MQAVSRDKALRIPQNALKSSSARSPVHAERILSAALHCIAVPILLDLVLEILACNQIWDVIIIIVCLPFATFCLLHGLVALS